MAKRSCHLKFLIEKPIRLHLRSYLQKMVNEQSEIFEKKNPENSLSRVKVFVILSQHN